MNEIKQHVLVSAIIIEDGKVLMQRRIDKIGEFDGKWTTPSGILELNEHPQDAVIREVKEELNVDIEVLQMLPLVDSFPNHKDMYHLVYLTFLCNIIGGELANTDEDGDISEIAWVKIDELDEEKLLRGTLPPILAAKKILNT